MEPSVSIIVPVYNAGKTISRCVDSILKQTCRDFELLLIDDGSTDHSGAICDDYQARDSRVRVFHQQNSGVSAARNLALREAKGEYLQFVDSDDWITPDATASMLRAARDNDCDMVIADFYRVVGEWVSPKGDIEETGVMTRQEFASHMMENPGDYYYGVLWNKLYRRQLVVEHRLEMNPAISWCEDFMFNLEYIRYTQRIIALQVPIYYYVKTKGSLVSQSVSLSRVVRMKLAVFEYYNQFYRTVLDEEAYEKSKLKIYRFLVDAAGDGVVPPGILPGSAKLGTERFRVNNDILAGEGPLFDQFRRRKLMDRYLETTALKHGLTLAEMRLMLYLRQIPAEITRADLADFVSLPLRTCWALLQKLVSRGLVDVSPEGSTREKGGKKLFRITFSSQASPILADLATTVLDYRMTMMVGLSQEEIGAYNATSEKIQNNIRQVL